jgi:hypothetical protein
MGRLPHKPSNGIVLMGTLAPCQLRHLTFATCSRILVPEQPDAAPGKIIYLGACLIAAVRLAREENWNNSPRVVSRISDAISLARRI